AVKIEQGVPGKLRQANVADDLDRRARKDTRRRGRREAAGIIVLVSAHARQDSRVHPPTERTASAAIAEVRCRRTCQSSGERFLASRLASDEATRIGRLARIPAN